MIEQIIYDGLTSKGLQPIAAGAFLGNIAAESGCVSNRMQGDFSAGYGKSAAYTEKVDNGALSRSDFMNDGIGYGLCQWTYPSRKAALYDKAKEFGMSVGSALLQIWFILFELDNEFSEVKTALNKADNLYDAVAIVLRKYEKPYDQSDSACAHRTAMAQAKMAGIDLEVVTLEDAETVLITNENFNPPQYCTFNIELTLKQDAEGYKITKFNVLKVEEKLIDRFNYSRPDNKCRDCFRGNSVKQQEYGCYKHGNKAFNRRG